MAEEECYQVITENYPNSGTDYDKLFQAILSIANKVGIDKALEMVSKRGGERRKAWLDKNLPKASKGADVFDNVLNIFYKGCVGVDIEKDGKIVERTDKKLVTRWWNYCPILEACKKYGLDTKEVCKKGFHNQNQFTLSQIDPRLKFDRDYETGIRPHVEYCEEIITIEK